MAVGRDLTRFTKKFTSFFKLSASSKVMKAVGNEARRLIVKRSRLGHGVESNMGQRHKFPKLSEGYIKARRDAPDLDGSTSPKKSNITFSGQLLKSMKVKAKRKSVSISPGGNRSRTSMGLGFPTNKGLALHLEKKMGRSFNYLSKQEFSQLRRFYRKTFGDLVKRKLR